MKVECQHLKFYRIFDQYVNKLSEDNDWERTEKPLGVTLDIEPSRFESVRLRYFHGISQISPYHILGIKKGRMKMLWSAISFSF